jgi:hypothetical protein
MGTVKSSILVMTTMRRSATAWRSCWRKKAATAARRGGREEALDLAGRESPDLTLVDLSLDGAVELVGALKRARDPGADLLDA